jgi:hypothetical protein
VPTPPEDFTIGVEEEYQIVNPQTRELRQRAARIVMRAREVVGEDVTNELFLSQIEIGTIAMGFSPRPQATGTEPQWKWTTVGTIPTGNALLTMTQSSLGAGPRSSQDGSLVCWQ